jgi:hypothetical protein
VPLGRTASGAHGRVIIVSSCQSSCHRVIHNPQSTVHQEVRGAHRGGGEGAVAPRRSPDGRGVLDDPGAEAVQALAYEKGLGRHTRELGPGLRLWASCVRPQL